MIDPKPQFECVVIDGVEPIFVEQMILGAMALRYARQTGLSYEDAVHAARATWESDWEGEGPRTFEQAIEAVDSDLEHWDD